MLSWIIASKCDHKYSYMRATERNYTKREGNVTIKAEIRVMRPQAKECRKLSDTGD